MKAVYSVWPGDNWHWFGAADWMRNYDFEPCGYWSVCVANMGLLSYSLAVVDDFGSLVAVLR